MLACLYLLWLCYSQCSSDLVLAYFLVGKHRPVGKSENLISVNLSFILLQRTKESSSKCHIIIVVALTTFHRTLLPLLLSSVNLSQLTNLSWRLFMELYDSPTEIILKILPISTSLLQVPKDIINKWLNVLPQRKLYKFWYNVVLEKSG